MQNITESLAGRAGIIQMSGISGKELESNTKIKHKQTEILINGSFPEPLANKNIMISNWYSSYISTYLERDVRNILNVNKLRDFAIFLKAVAIRSGQILSYSDLSRDVGLSVNTIKEWISVLETSQIVYLLKPYFRNLGKRLVKSPKLYLKDTGLMCHLCGINNVQSLENSPLKGEIWETYVLNQLLSNYYQEGVEPNIWFYRNQSMNEIDFIIDEGLRLTAIEAKYAERPNLDKVKKNYEALKNHYGEENVSKLIIKTSIKKEFAISDQITLSPGWVY